MAKKKATEEKRTKHETPEIPALQPGDVVAVNLRIREGDKERTQTFEGTVIRLRGAGENKSFTVRKVSRGYGIERIFPFRSPVITSVQVKRHSKVRRSKLYYLRGRKGRGAQLKERKVEPKARPAAVEE
ncbi:MAG: 50S ribosomal protein L19 [candidate division WOR-3 bacterium]|nr:MAG: 50S ribosomal protein L19 [candidate division WOR-3 bacterium]